MNIDERIKKELEQASEIEEQNLAPQQGMFELFFASYKGGLRRWVILVTVITLVVTAVMVWVGYSFFTANTLQDQLFWGICLIAVLIVQVSLKQWSWMEMNRNSVLREIKRLEVEVFELKNR